MISLFSKKSALLSDPGKRYYMVLYPLFWGTLAILLCFYITRPICDPDFWWHLKSGDLMIKKNGLLRTDPFNYTGDGIVRGFQAVLLYGYWLWETVAASLFKALGYNGIFLLKFFTAFQLAWGVLFEMSRQRLSQFTMILLTGLGALVLINVYHLERPQLFSFFFMTLLIGMISRIRMGHPPSFLLFPLMILWANVHRGFVVGDILLALSAAGFLIRYRHDNSCRLRYITWAAAGILLSFINPNGWATITELLSFMQNSIGPAYVNEYRSSWQLFMLQSKIAAGCLWGLAALHLISLFLDRRRFWPEIFISLFIIAFGLAYVRNTGFIAVSLLPMTGWYVEQAYARFNIKLPGYARATICVLFVATISWLVLGERAGRNAAHDPVNSYFPVKMTKFLKSSGLCGNLFNDYNAGGYLNWALYPQWKTFIDGRELDPKVSNQYLKILSGSAEYIEGKAYYEFMLDHYRIDVVALGIASSDGRLQPLLKLLLNRQEWIPVFLDNQSFVLARFTPQNAAAIRELGLDKNYFLDMLTLLIANNADNSTKSISLLILYADILSYGGKLKEAEAVLHQLDAESLDPGIRIYLRNCMNS